MLQQDSRSYGLTTEDALQAYQDDQLENLAATNRWRYALIDHAAGIHRDQPDAFRRICLACRSESRPGRGT